MSSHHLDRVVSRSAVTAPVVRMLLCCTLTFVLAACGSDEGSAATPATPTAAPAVTSAVPVAATAADPTTAHTAVSGAATLIGKTLPPYPDGLDEIQGACIPGGDGLDHACDFGLAAIGRRQGETAELRYVLLSRNVGNGAPQPRWQVMDAVDFPQAAEGYELQLGGCRHNAVDDAALIAIVRHHDEEFSSDVSWARRYDIATGKLVELPTAGVDCISLGFGE